MDPAAFFFDAELCVGCKTCQVACKDKNGLGPGDLIRRVVTLEYGRYPNASCCHLSLSCHHCMAPRCMPACPVGALTRDEDGVVRVDGDRCVGCGRCERACPFGNIQVIQERKRAVKCDGCADLRALGQAPVCVAACPMRALEFGPLPELKKRHPDGISVGVLYGGDEGPGPRPGTLLTVRDVMLREEGRVLSL